MLYIVFIKRKRLVKITFLVYYNDFICKYNNVNLFCIGVWDNGGSYTSLNTAKEMAAVFGEVFQSDALRKLIAEDMGVASVEGTISIELVSETNLMLLTVTSDSPRHAYQMAQSALDKYNRVSDYLFSNARLDTLKSPTIPYSPPNPLQMSKLRRMGALAAAGVVAALIVLTSYLRFTVKKRGLAKKQLDGPILGSIPYERKTHSLREVLKKKRNKRPLLISSLLMGMPFIRPGNCNE